MTRPNESRFNAKTRQALAATGLPPMFAVRAATADAPAEILLYDEIGFWGVTAKDFAAAVAQAGAGPLTVRINSPGGEVFDGLAIYNTLKAHPGGVTCVVDGLAASAASFIALAGSSVQMAESSLMMIHNAAGVVAGNRHGLRQVADTLDKIDGTLAAIYSAKNGAPVADTAVLMDAETWYTAAEAKAAGLCDSICAAPDKKTTRAGVTVNRAVAVRGALRAAFDPDGDGDDDVAEAIGAILAAQDSLQDAVAALTGAPADDATTDAVISDLGREIRARRLRIAMAQ